MMIQHDMMLRYENLKRPLFKCVSSDITLFGKILVVYFRNKTGNKNTDNLSDAYRVWNSKAKRVMLNMGVF